MKRTFRTQGAPGAAMFALLAAVGLALSSPPSPRQQPKPAPLSALTAEQWTQDIDTLGSELPKRHKNLFARISETDFRTAVAELKAALPSLAPDERLVRLLKLVASVGDSHTGLGYRPSAAFPLMAYWYDDGIWIRNTVPPHESLLRGRITAVGGRPIEDVATALAALIPHENEAQVRGQLPSLLTDPFVLHGLKLIDRSDAARFTVRDASGAEHAADLRAVPADEHPSWIVDLNAESAAFLALKNRQQDYWFEILPQVGSLYFQYNSCRETPGKPFAAFVKEMFAAAEAAGVERAVVDLRYNGGGNSMIFRPFVTELKARPALNQKGRIFVLIGRRTFSSALMNAVEMKLETAAILAGEPTGGKPNHFGEIKSLLLPVSGLVVTYSTKYFKEVEGDPVSLEPDLRVKVDFADFLARRDLVLDAALKYGQQVFPRK